MVIVRSTRSIYSNTMEPQTKKQGHKSAKEKKENPNRLGSSKHVRLAEIRAEKRKGAKRGGKN